MGVTIKDVAKYAGVSFGTVSRAFNGYTDISEKTKQQIFDAAKQLGYAPNVNARSLSAKNANNIGMIISGFLESEGKDNSAHLLLQGVYRYAFQKNLEMSLYAITSDKQNQKPYMRFCLEHSLSGAVLSGITTKDTYFKELVSSNFPCVLIDVHLKEKGKRVGCVSIDNYEAAGAITKHLLDYNHRDILVISGKKEASVTTERIAGIFQMLEEHGITLLRERILYCEYSEETAYKTVKKYLKKNGKGKITAFLCLSDLMALGVMKAVKELGYSVPDDFSIVGFDGLPITEYTTPGLTTVFQDFTEIGYQAAALLDTIMNSKDAVNDVYVPYKIMERGSVKKWEPEKI